MATQFKRLQAAVTAGMELLERAATSDAELATRIDAATALQALVQEHSADASKLHARASEVNPDKQTYGPAMVAKVLEAVAAFNDLAAAAEPVCVEVSSLRAAVEALESVRALAVRQEAEAAVLAREREGQAQAALRSATMAAEAAAAEARAAAVREAAAAEASAARAEEERRRIEQAAAIAAAATAALEAKQAADAEAERVVQQEKEARRRRTEEVVAKHKTPVPPPALPATGAATRASGMGAARTPVLIGKFNEVAIASAFQALIAEHRDQVVVVYVTAPWCGTCTALAPFLDALVTTLPEVLFARVNGDSPTTKAFLPPFRGFPTLFLYFRGAVLRTLVGPAPAAIQAAVRAVQQEVEEVVLNEAIALSTVEVDYFSTVKAPLSVTTGTSTGTGASSGGSTGTAAAVSVPDFCGDIAHALNELRKSVSRPEFLKAVKFLCDSVGKAVDDPAAGVVVPKTSISFRAALGRHAKDPACMTALGFVPGPVQSETAAASGGSDEEAYVLQPLTDSDEDCLKLVTLVSMLEYLRSDAVMLDLPSSSFASPAAPVPATATVATVSSEATELSEDELIAQALMMSMGE